MPHTPLKRARLPVPPLPHTAGLPVSMEYYSTKAEVCQEEFSLFLRRFAGEKLRPLAFRAGLRYNDVEICIPTGGRYEF